jgi:NAD(P)-dependent dehydrogenase (short-subunit alcohol dehydrogenase family)
MSVALVTGGSRGLGNALAGALLAHGWSVVTDARNAAELEAAALELRSGPPAGGELRALAGDVTDANHREALVAVAADLGGLDLVVNNAGILGPSPQPRLAEYPLERLREVYEANTIAALGVLQATLPLLRRSSDPRLLNVTSDASVQPYEGWGGYGSAKAALDQLGRVLAVEEAWLRVWTVDPGDMATQMHQEAFPGEDISDRPSPRSVVGTLVELIHSQRPSGRYMAADLAERSHR